MTVTLGELSKTFGLELRGDAQHVVNGVGTLKDATAQQVAFLANASYRGQLPTTGAGVVVLAADDAEVCPTNSLIAQNPYLAYARIAARFDKRATAVGGIHPSAVVAPSAQIDESAAIGPQTVIESNATVGAGAQIGPGCVVGAGSHIGAHSRLKARVVVCEDVQIGQRVLIHPGAVIGADGFGIAPDESGSWVKVPQLGSVRIGDDCEIGANSTIDRGAIEDTVLAEDVRLDNLVQIGHNAQIGAHTALAGCAAVAGSTRVGARCLIGGGVGIVGHIEITDGVTVTARTLVTRSITKAGVYSSGAPMEENTTWRRNAARMRQLDKIARQVAQLAKDKKA